MLSGVVALATALIDESCFLLETRLGISRATQRLVAVASAGWVTLLAYLQTHGSLGLQLDRLKLGLTIVSIMSFVIVSNLRFAQVLTRWLLRQEDVVRNLKGSVPDKLTTLCSRSARVPVLEDLLPTDRCGLWFLVRPPDPVFA